MREIKFRAWDKVCKPNRIKTWEQLLAQYQLTQVFVSDYFILMQYTGIKDKNGKEIYEGDVVEYKDFSGGLYLFREQPKTTGIIKINNLLRGIYLKGMGTFEGSKAEVIGNIYDNPELLEMEGMK